jgi:hypothetical protein
MTGAWTCGRRAKHLIGWFRERCAACSGSPVRAGGLGGWFAVRGAISAGTLVSLALLLSIRYGPLSSLANARESIRSALGAAWPYRAAHRPPAVHGSRR